MKKILYMMMAAALLAACDNPLEYKPESKADELVLNAHLSADEQWHTVYVAVSHTEYVSMVSSGELSCYVNGSLVAKTNTLTSRNDEYMGPSKYFTFKADFKAGDKVRIEVAADGFKASNEQIVPDAPTVTKVDTVTVRQRDEEGYVNVCYRFDTTLKDSDPEESFFRLTLIDHGESTFYKDNVEIGQDTMDKRRDFWADDDPVLNEGHFMADEMPFEIGSTNKYGIITDNMFANGTATLKPVISKNSFGLTTIMEGADSVKVATTAIVKVYGISKAYFYYFKALNSISDGGGDLALEDVQIPDNIDGGIGFIGIANPSSTGFYLGERSYPLMYYGGENPPLPE